MSVVNKRSLLEEESSGSDVVEGETAKKKKIFTEPAVQIGPVSTLEDMEKLVLKFQHDKLKQRVELHRKQENELRDRIEQLEKRQTQDDVVLNVMNKYWNQLNEEICSLLMRFDAENSDENETINERAATKSFLAHLSNWDRKTLDDKSAKRVRVSTRALGKLIQAFDRLQQRNEKVTKILSGETGEKLVLSDGIRKKNIELHEENNGIQARNSALHENYRIMSLKLKELLEQLTAQETKGDELQNKVDDLKWEVSKLILQNDKLTDHVISLTTKYQKLQQNHDPDDKKAFDQPRVITEPEIVNLQRDNEETKELADGRLAELERLKLTNQKTREELERLQANISDLSESQVRETTEFICLQSKFSVVYADNRNLREVLDNTRQHVSESQSIYSKQTEEIKNEESQIKAKLKTDLNHLESQLDKVRKDYLSFKVTYDESVASNEESKSLVFEMQDLIKSLRAHNRQTRNDVHGYRRKYRDMGSENEKLIQESFRMELQMINALPSESTSVKEAVSGGAAIQRDALSGDAPGTSFKVEKGSRKQAEGKIPVADFKDAVVELESDEIKEHRSLLKKVCNETREIKLLLDMYKGVDKEQKEKVELMASERKNREEILEYRKELKRLQKPKMEEDDTKAMPKEDAMSRIQYLEDQLRAIARQITAQKQEEDAMVNEMEVTGQAYEDMQEQNGRLLQEMKEKDATNFKLISDRIKSAQGQKLSKDEMLYLQSQAVAFSKQVEARNKLVREYEKKEDQLFRTSDAMENEATLRLQATEQHRRKAIENAQTASDRKLHVEKYHSQMKDAQTAIGEKSSSLEAEAYKSQRLQEEVALLKRKLDRLNKIELTGNTDQVMLEEIREYKEILTCPSCKDKRKDAVLIKCFHVFCYDCLRTRYETRRRKCPKCNAAFGANDYHRLYLS